MKQFVFAVMAVFTLALAAEAKKTCDCTKCSPCNCTSDCCK